MRLHLSPSLGWVLGLALGAVAGCGNHSLGESPTLSGQIDGWNRGSGYTLQATVGSSSSNSSPVLASAPIDAAGNFSITLPGGDVLAPYIMVQHVDPNAPISSCSGGNLQVSQTDIGSAGLNLHAVSGTTSLSVNQGSSMPTNTSVLYVYIDRDVSETGTISCMFGTGSIQESVDLHFGKGWNHEILTLSTGMITAVTDPIPDGVKWTAK